MSNKNMNVIEINFNLQEALYQKKCYIFTVNMYILIKK